MKKLYYIRIGLEKVVSQGLQIQSRSQNQFLFANLQNFTKLSASFGLPLKTWNYIIDLLFRSSTKFCFLFSSLQFQLFHQCDQTNTSIKNNKQILQSLQNNSAIFPQSHWTFIWGKICVVLISRMNISCDMTIIIDLWIISFFKLQMSKHNKKNSYQKNDYSDEQVYEEIKDKIREIRDKNLKNVEQAVMIADEYNRCKQQKRKRKIMKEKDSTNRSHVTHNMPYQQKNSSEDDEEGQINDKKNAKPQYTALNDVPSISNLGDHIRPLTLTRNKITDLLNSRRFEELVKGCFVRYLSDSNSGPHNSSYIIAQIVGVTEGVKEYSVNNAKTKILLKLQETSQNIVTLSLQLISNQHPPGGLEIQKWLQTNRNKIPKEKELKQKLQEHNKLLVEQLSSTEIDINIWKKAKKIAEQDVQPKEDITHLVDFVGDKLHNLQVRLQEGEIGRKTEKVDLQSLKKQIIQAGSILQKLKEIRQRFLSTKLKQKKQQKKNERRIQLLLSQQKRKDAINQKCKARTIMLATIDGYNKLKNTILQNHQKFSFDLD